MTAIDRDESGSVLRNAFATLDLDAIEEVSDDLGQELPVQWGQALAGLAERIPAREMEKRPRLLLATFRAQQLDRDADDPAHRRLQHFYVRQGRAYADVFESFPRVRDAFAAGMISVIGARLRGDYDEAERLAHRVGRIRMLSAELPLSHVTALSGADWLSAERALTAVLDGRFADATTHARAAFDEGGRAPRSQNAAIRGAGYAAMLAALTGGRARAQDWLRRHEEVARTTTPLRHSHQAPAALTRALLALDLLDALAAHRHLLTLGDPTAGLELWPLIAAAWSRYDLLFEDPSTGLARLDEITFGSSRDVVSNDTIAGGLLLRARADLLLEEGEGNAVLAMAARHPTIRLLRIPAARAHLRVGDASRALRLASAYGRKKAVPHREATDALLIMAVAQLHRGEDADAVTLFREAMGVYAITGNVSAFREIDSADLQVLCERAEVANPLDRVLPAERRRPGSPVNLVRLTRREHVVLRALAGPENTEAIAARLNVSINTVRTQMRGIYRKLGVSSRADAVGVAMRRGVLSTVPHADAPTSQAIRRRALPENRAARTTARR